MGNNSMLETVKSTISEYRMLEPGEPVVCALSGGADSTALLRVLLELGYGVRAYHLNHCLRGAESDRDEEFCRRLCIELGVPLIAERLDVHEEAEKQGESLETAARKLRYERFSAAAKGIKIATAHTADDNVETVLFNLARGTGAKGLAGIPPVRGNIVRPLIAVKREDVESYLSALGQVYVTDSTNAGTDFTRNRIRHGAVPVLRGVNPNLAETVGRLCGLLRQDDGYLTMLAEQAVSEASGKVGTGDGAFDVRCLLEKHPAVRSRALRIFAKRAGMPMKDFSALHVDALGRWLESGNPSAECSLPHGFTARREYASGRIVKEPGVEGISCVHLPVPCDTVIGDGHTRIRMRRLEKNEVFNKSFNTFCVDCGTIDFETLCVRSRHTGDRIRLSENGCGRTLKKLMIDRKIPRMRREGIAVIADKNGVIAVQDIGIDAARLPGEGGRLVIKIERIEG